MTQRIAATLLLLLSIAPTAQRPTDGDWPMYGRDGGAERHSPLTQINRSNVSTLQQAWSFVGSKIVALFWRRRAPIIAWLPASAGRMRLSWFNIERLTHPSG